MCERKAASHGRLFLSILVRRPHVIEDGQNGFLVPIRSSAALAEKLELLYRDRELLHFMSRNALERAAQHGWAKYRERLVETVREVLEC